MNARSYDIHVQNFTLICAYFNRSRNIGYIKKSVFSMARILGIAGFEIGVHLESIAMGDCP